MISCMHAKLLQLCLTLCYPMDCSLPGSSVHGVPRQEHWSELPFPPLGDLADPGIKLESPVSLTLAGGLFTTSATWETHMISWIPL